MILPLRKRHRRMTLILAIAVSVISIAGLMSRQTVPATKNIAAFQDSGSPQFDKELLSSDNIWGEMNIKTRILSTDDDTVSLALELTPQKPLKIPDLLVYWHSQTAAVGETLPAGSYCIGALSGAQKKMLLLPREAISNDGSLILYSLAHQKRIASVNLQTKSLLVKEAE